MGCASCDVQAEAGAPVGPPGGGPKNLAVDARLGGGDAPPARGAAAAPEEQQEACADAAQLPPAVCASPCKRRRIGSGPAEAGVRPALGDVAPVALDNCDQVLPLLYLGGLESTRDAQRMVQEGICAVVCCMREFELPSSNFSEQLLDYFRVDVEDVGREPIEAFIPEALAFVHARISRGQAVLVHCRAGVSRSTVVVIAYLVVHQGYSLQDAFLFVLKCRPGVAPNIGFMEKLVQVEKETRKSDPTVDMDSYTSWYGGGDLTTAPDLAPA